ncbi:hypothetical protein CcI156_05205 [Frankia sp. CcI156]|uniref:Uncharacterized protein n=1 Tax=Frankia casuarinae (strain DSM 45818 / CECT 9043 / HFP020203 / CcI3) TaxID=106370 RepID=Q2JCS4_FRACC|nr:MULTISPECIES: hypothetical protein [Frankia]OHV57755.1 hypothetical protein CgIS1_01065 [Frankia sp. CgIS1]ABD10918.1 hypothetical protein Francci3_1542 [Frankia casuarinae]ETA02231.1 hypothetical protein CcI6DRAFT_02406 [Frankia sp. CcI6]EYT92397.1 hypothetical protein ThrDRAFT_02007 [Frankia casuarinae]KDA42913.1 hypothetical protein BMG523Draft_02302 [Frankia sp. BMG5.23]
MDPGGAGARGSSAYGHPNAAVRSAALSWRSTEQQAYAPLRTTWSTAAGELTEDILALKTAVHDSNGSFQQTEQAITRTFTV